jgi:hypothetical protein
MLDSKYIKNRVQLLIKNYKLNEIDFFLYTLSKHLQKNMALYVTQEIKAYDVAYWLDTVWNKNPWNLKRHTKYTVCIAPSQRPYDLRICDITKENILYIPNGVKNKKEEIKGCIILIELKSIKKNPQSIPLNDTPICSTCNGVPAYHIVQTYTSDLSKSNIWLIKGSDYNKCIVENTINTKYEDVVERVAECRDYAKKEFSQLFNNKFFMRLNFFVPMSDLEKHSTKFPLGATYNRPNVIPDEYDIDNTLNEYDIDNTLNEYDIDFGADPIPSEYENYKEGFLIKYPEFKEQLEQDIKKKAEKIIKDAEKKDIKDAEKAEKKAEKAEKAEKKTIKDAEKAEKKLLKTLKNTLIKNLEEFVNI